MVYIKWFTIFCLYVLMLPTLLVVPFIIALIYKEEEYKDDGSYTWGWIWGTYDNPPQGDEGFVAKRSFFPNITTGLKGYINRVQWMWRNKLYGLDKYTSLKYKPSLKLQVKGKEDISDKEKVPGWYWVKAFDGKKLVGFELYCVLPWSDTRNLRARLGWKILTDKFERFGFAPHVNTFNPFDGYGDD